MDADRGLSYVLPERFHPSVRFAGLEAEMAKRLLTLGAIAVIVLFLAGCDIFGDGSFVVGTGITQASPGTYRSAGGPDCYWQRTTTPGGSFSTILSSDFLSGPDVVTILPSDGGFTSQGCGNWTPLPSSGPEVTEFGNGAYAVGIDIAPGTYSAPGGNGCYWEEDSNFLWNGDSIIANGVPGGPVTVTLSADAAAFKVQRCGTWTLVGTQVANNCFLNPQGNCYQAGQICPDSLHGLTVEGENGAITCVEQSDGVWLWENTANTCFVGLTGTCYVAGEICPASLHGATVQGEAGPITCVEENGVFVWENVSQPGAPTGNNCFLDPQGNCYRAGEFCPVSLHGATVQGQAGPITCVLDNDGIWRWSENA